MSTVSASELYVPSDINKPIWLSKVRNYKDTSTETWSTTFLGLMHELYNRPDFSPVKEGAGFLIGPCRNGKRNNENLMYSCVGVIDAARVGAASEPPEADASISTTPGVVCAIMTADCLPVLLADEHGTEIVVRACGRVDYC
jgi:hypothetical protein